MLKKRVSDLELAYIGAERRKIAYDRAGAGEPIIFLHGIGGNRTNWQEQLEAFAGKYDAIAWDARGYGDSDDYSASLVFSEFANDLALFMDALDIHTAHIVGLSMGGMIAQDFCARFPARVGSLTLAATSAGLGILPEDAKKDFVEKRLSPLERGLSPADIAPNVVEVLLGRRASAVTRDRLVESLSMLRAEPYCQTIRAIVSTDFRDVLGQINVPTLVIVGGDDKVLPPENSRYLAAEVPRSELVILEEVGHLLNIEAAAEFNFRLFAFLNANPLR